MSELCKCLNGEPNSICMFHGATDAANGGPCFDDRARLNRVPGMKLIVGVHNRCPSILGMMCEDSANGWISQSFFDNSVKVPFIPGIGALPASSRLLNESGETIRRSAPTTAIADAFDTLIGFEVTNGTTREISENEIELGSLAYQSLETCGSSSLSNTNGKMPLNAA